MPPTPKQATAAKAFLQQILDKHIPADQREAIGAHFLTNDGLLAEVGTAVLAQGDYSRQTQELAAERTRLTDWFAENEPVAAKAKKLLERFPDGEIPDDFGTRGAAEPPAIDPAKLKTEVGDALAKRIEESERGAVTFFGALTDLAQEHQRLFGEPLNTSEFIKNPRVYEIGLQNAHREIFAEKYTAKATAETQAKIDLAVKAENERLTAEFQKKQIAQPYPVASTRNPVMAALDEQRTAQVADPTLAPRPFANRVDAGAAAEEYQKLAGVPAGV